MKNIYFTDYDINSNSYIIENIGIKYIDSTINYGLIANRDIKRGDIAYSVPSVYVSSKSNVYYNINKSTTLKINHEIYMTNVLDIDIDGDELYEFTYFDIFINHSCNPNCYYDESNKFKKNPKDQVVIALQDISKGEQLFVNYDGIDWINDEPFTCKDCSNIKRGFYYLSSEQQKDYIERGIVTNYVLQKYQNYKSNL